MTEASYMKSDYKKLVSPQDQLNSNISTEWFSTHKLFQDPY